METCFHLPPGIGSFPNGHPLFADRYRAEKEQFTGVVLVHGARIQPREDVRVYHFCKILNPADGIDQFQSWF